MGARQQGQRDKAKLQREDKPAKNVGKPQVPERDGIPDPPAADEWDVESVEQVEDPYEAVLVEDWIAIDTGWPDAA